MWKELIQHVPIGKLIVKYNHNGDMTVLVVHSVVNYNVPYDEVAV